jgi:hypothetical protein
MMKDNWSTHIENDRQERKSSLAWESVKLPGLMLASAMLVLVLFTGMHGATSPFNGNNNSLQVAVEEQMSSLSPVAVVNWVLILENQNNGSCLSGTDCCDDIICYGLEYTPAVSGDLTSYTTGFFIECLSGMVPVISNSSCTMTDQSFLINECMLHDSILFNSSGHNGALAVTSGVPVVLHQVCFSLSAGQSIMISEDPVTDLTASIDLTGGGFTDEFPLYTPTTVSKSLQVWPPDMDTTVACLYLATAPVVPDVFDICGNPMDVELISTTDNPDPITCEGNRT